MPLALRRLPGFSYLMPDRKCPCLIYKRLGLVFVDSISTHPFSFLHLSPSALFDIVLGQLNLQLPELQNWCSHVTSLGIGNEKSNFSAGEQPVEPLPS